AVADGPPLLEYSGIHRARRPAASLERRRLGVQVRAQQRVGARADDVRSGALPCVNQSRLLKQKKRLADYAAADAETTGQNPLRGQTVSRGKVAAPNIEGDVLGHGVGQPSVFRRRHGCKFHIAELAQDAYLMRRNRTKRLQPLTPTLATQVRIISATAGRISRLNAGVLAQIPKIPRK